jgi:hypothetical protein
MAKVPKDEPPPKEIVLLEGVARRIVFVQSTTGRSPARDYLFDLDESEQRKFATRFTRLGAGHQLRNPEHIRDLGEHSVEGMVDGNMVTITKKVWEVKIDGHRMLAFQDGNNWVLTNGCPKINKKAFQSEIDTAVNVMADYFSR